MSLTLAHKAAAAAAAHHQRLAEQCDALARLLRAMELMPEEPMPVEELAQMLMPLGLRLVHRHALRDAICIIKQTEDVDGLSGEELDKLKSALELAMEGRAS